MRKATAGQSNPKLSGVRGPTMADLASHATPLNRWGGRRAGTGVVVALLVSFLLAGGCTPPGPVINQEQSHLVFLPGIGGSNPLVRRLVGMVNGELPGFSAQTWDWTDIERVTPLGDLVNEELNRTRAGKLAEELVAWREAHPQDKLLLAATSGGAGLVLFTCEALPADFEIERVIFLSAALSPDVDLSPILSRSRRGIFNYFSKMDVAVLGLGTTLFGTTNRRHTSSAGLVGFEEPAAERFAGKIEQLAWCREFVRLGNFGGHSGGFATEFLREFVLPELRE